MPSQSLGFGIYCRLIWKYQVLKTILKLAARLNGVCVKSTVDNTLQNYVGEKTDGLLSGLIRQAL